MKTITILKSEYDSLVRDAKFLNALQANGVDNWDGYDYAVEEAFPEDDDL